MSAAQSAPAPAQAVPVPGPAGADVDREVERRLAGLPEEATPAEQLPVLEELHDMLAERLGEANG